MGDGTNTYLYAGANPTAFYDLLGLYKCSYLAQGNGGGSGRTADGMKLCDYKCRCKCDDGKIKTVTVQGGSSGPAGGQVCLGAVTATGISPGGNNTYTYTIGFREFGVDTEPAWYNFLGPSLLEDNLSKAMDKVCDCDK